MAASNGPMVKKLEANIEVLDAKSTEKQKQELVDLLVQDIKHPLTNYEEKKLETYYIIFRKQDNFDV